MLGDVNKLFVFKSFLTMPINVLPLHLKQTFPPIIFTEGEGDGIESRLPFKIFSTLLTPALQSWVQSCYVIGWNFCSMHCFYNRLAYKSTLVCKNAKTILAKVFQQQNNFYTNGCALKTKFDFDLMISRVISRSRLGQPVSKGYYSTT